MQVAVVYTFEFRIVDFVFFVVAVEIKHELMLYNISRKQRESKTKKK